MEYRFLIFSSEQKVLNAMLSNCGSLLAIIVCGILNRQMIFFHTKLEMSLFFMLA